MAKGESAYLRLVEFSEEDADRFEELTSAGKRGGPEIRAMLAKYPATSAKAGELSRHIAGRIIKRVAPGDDSFVAECIRHRCAEIRRDLGYDDAPAVERLLIDRIVVTWLHLYDVESIRQSEGKTLTQAAYYNKAASMAQADHVRALVALAKVRKLALPAVQVNVTSGNQLNVAV